LFYGKDRFSGIFTSRDYRAFQSQQPLLGGQSVSAAVAVEFAICADDAVAGNDQRHGVHGVGGSHGAIGVGTVDLARDLDVGAGLPVGDAEHGLQGFALERGEQRPIDGDGEGGAPAVQVFAQFLCVGHDPFGVGLP